MCKLKEEGIKRTGLSFFSSEEHETEALGERLAELLEPGDVIGFYGDLGAGKTAFVRGLARALQAKETVSSPTFVLMHIYEGRIPVYHFDAYRLKDAGDLINIGAEEYIGGDGIACVEWSERVEEILPADRLYVSISYETEKLGPCGRKLKFEAVCGRGLEIVEALKGDSAKN
ncbi:tRNA (adenosine(37)-N6)-threonylcarbamoyltransferase complex ATPase subunit type 1 TsaE [bacterium]|nr:tRNA (adenosine(37)-N6)-threonylcarbamoyltransferase complex ATPase subunit type 1 TsaE [bacterium]